MRILTALLASVMFVSLAGVSPALAHDDHQDDGLGLPEHIDSEEFYAEHDHEHGIENEGFELLVRSLPPAGGSKPTIYITLDDGASYLTPEHIKLHEKYTGYKATYFDNCREQVPESWQRLLDSGNAIGLHGCNHADLRTLSRSGRISEMQRNADFINAHVQENLAFGCYRPGFGGTNDSVRGDLASIGLTEYLWNRDPRDWESPGVNVILAELEGMQDGDIIVMHHSNGKEQTVQALSLFLERHHDDFIFGTLPDCAKGAPACETGSFDDVCVEDMFFDAIEWMKETGLTKGCDVDGTRFCPDDYVTRGQMAAFLTRAFNLPQTNKDWFGDDDSSTFEPAINRIAEAGITIGCNPPDNTKFCSSRSVTRGQMAAFLVRALGLSDDGGGDLFADDDGSVFEPAIDRLGASGITKGCDVDGTRFCPDDYVTRGQMAAFLRRALN